MSLGKRLLIAESLPATDSFQEAYSLQTCLKDVFIFGKKKKEVSGNSRSTDTTVGSLLLYEVEMEKYTCA